MADLGTLRPTTKDADGANAFDVDGDNVLNDDSDSTGCLHTQNTSLVEEAYYVLPDMPANFVSMDSLSIQVRHQGLTSHGNTTVVGVIRVYKADRTTGLHTALIAVANGDWTDAAATTSATAVSGLNTTATKADWDGAVVLVGIQRTRSKGGDSGSFGILEVWITGTYTPSGPAAQTVVANLLSQTAAPFTPVKTLMEVVDNFINQAPSAYNPYVNLPQTVSPEFIGGSGRLQVAQDDMSPDATDSLGSADIGGDYTLHGTASLFDKVSGFATLAVPAASNSELLGSLNSVKVLDAEVRFKVRVNAANADAAAFGVLRWDEATDYGYLVGIWFESDGTTTALIYEKNGSTPFENTHALSQGSYSSGEDWWVAGQVEGSALRCKVWKDGTSEPSSWATTDTDTSITAAGGVGFSGFISFGGVSRTLSFSDFSVYDLRTYNSGYAMESNFSGRNAAGFDTADNGGDWQYNASPVKQSWEGLDAALTDFSGSASSGWATADVGGSWSIIQNGGSDANINEGSGVGTMFVPASNRIVMSLASVDEVDLDLVALVSIDTDPADHGCGIRFREQGTENCYEGGIWFESDGTYTCYLHKWVSGTPSNVVSGVTGLGSYDIGDVFAIRIKAVGNSLKVKVWYEPSGQPATWQIDTTDSTYTTSGEVGLAAVWGGGATEPTISWSYFRGVVVDGTAHTYMDTANARHQWLTGATYELDYAVALKVKISANGTNGKYAFVWGRANNFSGSPLISTYDGYTAVLIFENDNSVTLLITKFVAGSETDPDSGPASAGSLGTWATDEYWWVELSMSGTSLEARTWKDGTSRPSSAQVSATDNDYTSGVIGLGIYNPNAEAVTYTFDRIYGGSLIVGENYSIFEPTEVRVSQNVVAQLLAQTLNVYNHTIAPGGVSVVAQLITNSPSLFNPQIVQAVQAQLIAQGYSAYDPKILQQVVAQLIDQAPVPYDPTVSPGGVTVVAQLIAQSIVAYNHDVAATTAPVVAQLIDQTAVTYDPKILQYVVAQFINQAGVTFDPKILQLVSAQLISNLAVAYDPTVSPGGVSVVTQLLSNPAVAYDPAVSPGPVSVVAQLISNLAVAYDPQILQLVVAQLIAQSILAYDPTVVATSQVLAELISATALLYEASVAQLIVVGTLSNGYMTYNPVVAPGNVNVVAQLITITPSVNGPLVSTGTTVAPPLIDDSGVTYDPKVSQQVDAQAISQAPLIYNPSVVQIVMAQLINQSGQTYEPKVNQEVVAQFISNLATLYDPQVAQQVAALLIDQSPQLFDPAVTTGTAVLVPTITNGNQVFTPDVSAVSTIVANLINQGYSAIDPSVGSLVGVGSLDNPATLNNPTITAVAQVLAELLDNGSLQYNPTISTSTLVAAQAISQAATVPSPDVLAGNLVVQVGTLVNGAIVYPVSIIGEQFILALVIQNDPVIGAPRIWLGIVPTTYKWDSQDDFKEGSTGFPTGQEDFRKLH